MCYLICYCARFVSNPFAQAFPNPALRQEREGRGTRRVAGDNEIKSWATRPHVWQQRFYDFNVRSRHKRVEKLRYIHRNPVRRGLV